MVAVVTTVILLVLLGMVKEGEAAIGVNWGTLSHHRASAKTVVDLLQNNKISKVKLFDADSQVLNALRGSQIQVMVGIPNQFLSLFSSSPPDADSWVRHNLSAYISAKPPVDIRSFSFPFHFRL